MKKRQLSFWILFITFSFQFSVAQNKNSVVDSPLNEVNDWFGAWKLIWTKDYKQKKIKTVDFVLFDNQYVYTTSKVTGDNAQPIAGPSLLNQKVQWFRKLHNNSLKLPNGEIAQIRMMCFASKTDNGAPFFVMPLTSYWKMKGANDHGIGIENLVTCVFLHEFGHTQQLQSNAGIDTAFEDYIKKHPDDNITDDLMQNYYEKDSTYVSWYDKERELFRNAAFAITEIDRQTNAKRALILLKLRQLTCVQKDKRDIEEMDNFFLTLEGVGQYNAFLWLTNKKGGKMSEYDARKALTTSSWSQEEGLDAIVLLSRSVSKEKLGKLMFSDTLTSVIDLLDENIDD